MNPLDNILQEYGLKYEDLNSAERETYKQSVFNIKNLSIGDLKSMIVEMKNSIALQLSDTPDTDEYLDTNRKLKARLKNYLVLEAFLTTPDKAEQALRKGLEELKTKS